MNNFKKSMIPLTIIVIVLLAVALSTATFAWFSASSKVSVQIISFTASKGEETNDLAISWYNNDTTSDKIDFAETKDMAPMIPMDLPYMGDSVGEFISNRGKSNFYTASQAEIGGVDKYSSTPRQIVVPKCLSPDGQDTFYLINKNETLGMKITVSYEMEGAIKNAICVAVFVNNAFVGILTELDEIAYGPIEIGTPIADQTKASVNDFDEKLLYKTNELEFFIPANHASEIVLVAWIDGTQIDNSGKEQQAHIKKIDFLGEYDA